MRFCESWARLLDYHMNASGSTDSSQQNERILPLRTFCTVQNTNEKVLLPSEASEFYRSFHRFYVCLQSGGYCLARSGLVLVLVQVLPPLMFGGLRTIPN